MKSKVYFFTARTHTHQESMSKFKAPLALKQLGIEEKIKVNDNIVVKTHFGALENTRYIRPSYIRFLCDYIKDLGAKPFVAESCGWGAPEEFTGVHTEYSGRATEKEYLEVAMMHGFTEETMGAPILMLDGQNGINTEIQQINGKKFNEIRVAGRLREFDKMILASHFKGHIGAGFGGAIKNLGIGCVSKGGKVEAHTGKTFEFNYDAPISDYEMCLKLCPTGALTEGKDGKIKRDESKCQFCYMCKSVCKNNAINIGESTREEFIIQMVDNAIGVVDFFGKDNIFYINYAIDIVYQCDCTGGSDIPFIPDIGILSSLDPVALDQACIDLTHLSKLSPYSVLDGIENLPILDGKCEWFSYIPRFDSLKNEMDMNLDGRESKHWELQLKAAEDIGLGSRDYDLIEVIMETKKK
ncbi:MAG: DUF362 domain-containing protein [Promethearchaeota archaeon]|nr:MAG: DUF362 domain-containing protein [Candidatus Lokiarchaeota archaeon]